MSNTTFPAIQDSQDVFIVTINSDLTEGRGIQYAHAVCKNESTAIRMGKGRDVQGTDARIIKSKRYLIDGVWFTASAFVYNPTDVDIQEEKILAKKKAEAIVLDKFQKGEEITAEERETILAMLKK